MNLYIARRVGLGVGLGLVALFGLSIPVLGLKGDDTYLSLALTAVGAVIFGCSMPRVARPEDDEARGFPVMPPAPLTPHEVREPGSLTRPAGFRPAAAGS